MKKRRSLKRRCPDEKQWGGEEKRGPRPGACVKARTVHARRKIKSTLDSINIKEKLPGRVRLANKKKKKGNWSGNCFNLGL